jgi:hypothetical protein
MGVFFLANCNSGGSGGTGTAPEAGTFVGKAAVLSGGEEVPPAATAANGSGILEVNTTTGTVNGRLTIGTSPTTTIIAAHVHEGARGANGSIVVILENSGSGAWSVPAGNALSPAQVNLFSAGTLYFNVRTAANPIGEIRGQIDGAVAAGAARTIEPPAAPARLVSTMGKKPHPPGSNALPPEAAGK